MAYVAQKNASGLYEVFSDGTRVATGTAAILPNYGLSETQLSSSAPAPTGIGTQSTQQATQPAPQSSPAPTSTPSSAPAPTSGTTPTAVDESNLRNTGQTAYLNGQLVQIWSEPNGHYYWKSNDGQFYDQGAINPSWSWTPVAPASNTPTSTPTSTPTGATPTPNGSLPPAPTGTPASATPQAGTSGGVTNEQLIANQQAAAKLGVSIPGVPGTSGSPAPTGSVTPSATAPITTPTAGVPNQITPAAPGGGVITENRILPQEVAALPNLQPGSTGDEVTMLQRFLLQEGFNIPSIQSGKAQFGYYGPETKAAVEAFQAAKGIDSKGNPGFFGPITKAYLQANPIAPPTTDSTMAGISTGQIATPTSLPNAQEIFERNFAQVLEELGISPPSALASPQTAFTELYQQIYTGMGLPTIKQQYDSTLKQFTDLQNELAEKKADIDDDPWMVQGIKDKRKESLDKRYETRLNTLTNQIKLYAGIYDSGREDARFISGQAMTAYNRSQDLNEKLILKAIDMAEKRSEAELDLYKKDEKGTTDIQEYNFAKSQGYKGTFLDYQRETANLKVGGGLLGGLSSAQLNSTINQIVGAFDNEPIVREYNTINTGVNYLKTLGNSPTDDIARIYQFAKIMDPNSAVREGEYATVQAYATALLQRYGLNAKRVFENTGFLTAEARTFLNTTLQKRLDISQAQYDNIYNQYQQRIEGAKSGNFNTLPDYSQTQFKQQYPPGTILESGGVLYIVLDDGESVKPIGAVPAGQSKI